MICFYQPGPAKRPRSCQTNTMQERQRKGGNMKTKTLFNGILMVVLIVWGIAVTVNAATFNVDITSDSNAVVYQGCDDAVSDDCSLRGAIIKANNNVGSDEIILSFATYNLTVTGADNNAVQGDLDILDSLTITGNNTTINANSLSNRVFQIILSSTVLSISGIRILKGNGFEGAAIYNLEGGKINATNCIFDQNNSGGTANNGGAIYNNGGTVTLTDCTFSSNTATNNGGAIYNNNGTVTISNCTFSSNTASGTDAYDGGGAIYNGNGSGAGTGTVNVSNTCSFTGNTATNNGGAIYNSATQISVTDTCTFSGNVATNNGGAIYSTTTLTVTDCNFNKTGGGVKNSAKYGGGIYDESTNLKVTGCTFSENSASVEGGGIYNKNGTATETIENCTFTSNTATTNGGGVYNNASSPTVKNCTFTSNTATTNGGGMYNNSSSPTVTNCTFSSNVANGSGAGTGGGGMYNGSSLVVSNCTFNSNKAPSWSGGGMYNNSSATVTNCTFSSNEASNRGGGMFGMNATSTVINCTFNLNKAKDGGGINGYDGKVNIKNTIVAGNNITTGTGLDVYEITTGGYNLIGDNAGATTSFPASVPITSHNANNDYVGTIASPINPNLGSLAANDGTTWTHALTPPSPAINNGTNTGAPTTDQRGKPVNGTKDIGAYEYQGKVPTLDLTTGTTIADVTETTATGSGTVTDDGGAGTLTVGVCWNTTGSPAFPASGADSCTSASFTGTGDFTASITPLAAGTKYYVRAYAKNDLGTVYASETNFPTLPSVPALEDANSITSTGFTAKWTQLTGQIVTGYKLQVHTTTDFTSVTPTVLGDVASEIVTGLDSGKNYYYRVCAYNDNDGAYPDDGTYKTVLTKPSAPTPKDESDITTASFKANWNELTGQTVSSYILEVSKNNFSSTCETHTVSNSIFSYAITKCGTDDPLKPGTIYYYRVYAVNTTGTGAESNTIEVVTKPSKPGILAATDVETGKFTAKWKEPENPAGQIVDKYVLEVSTEDTFNTFDTYEITGSLFKEITKCESDDPLVPGKDYYYRVFAVNSGGTSVPSDIQSVNTAKLTQEITFATLPGMSYGSPSFEITATASSGLQVNFSSENPSVAAVSASTLDGTTKVSKATVTIYNAGDAESRHRRAATASITLPQMLAGRLT